MLCQLYVHLPDPSDPTSKLRLSCLMYQRSADLGLGIPFNIASYAILTHLIAQLTDTEAHQLIIQLGDAHVYRDHVDALKIQVEREPRAFPKIRWRRDMSSVDLDDVEPEDVIIEGYKPHPAVSMKMSV